MAGLSPQNPPQTQTQTQTPNPNTLLIRHLPSAIPEATLSRLFSHYGASSVRPCPSHGRLRNCAFVDFHNEALAVQALRQLNGLRFLGKVLKVEKASKATNQSRDENKSRSSYSEAQLGSDFVRPTASTAAFSGGIVAEGVSNTRSFPAAEPIAPRLGVDYSFPPYLEYAYPSPDGNILTNIVNALIAVPRFYTQVLHLMNKMNIPAPFRMAMPTPPLPPLAPMPPPPPPPLESTKQQLTELSSEESEMDSSDEEVDKIISTSGASRSSKRIKRDSILRPAVDKGVAHDAVGVKPATLTPKEIPVIKKRNPVLQIKIATKADQRDHDDDSTTRETEEPKLDSSDIKPYATPEEIKNGKLALEELVSLPVFKNYKPGNPASILYIKNLAKDVIVDDFYYIFGSLFGNTDEAKSSLGVKLMQEGRMRGQAFVTFPSVELAHQALNLVNGYEFKGKPMVIQFGRNPAAAKEK